MGMRMKKQLFIGIGFIFISSLLSADIEKTIAKNTLLTEETINKSYHCAKHYTAHAVTAFIPVAGLCAFFALGDAIDRDSGGFVQWEGVFKQTAVGLGMFCMYKTPHWTDQYLLQYTHQRTLYQDAITALPRLLPIFTNPERWPITIPLGTVIGEYLADATHPNTDEN